jgi:hypothetical protein
MVMDAQVFIKVYQLCVHACGQLHFSVRPQIMLFDDGSSRASVEG